ncbi:DUF3558 family protein [Amycolatopsis sp. lyj-346]|uniref:DUF3558 family protein n=1 Tax=Amycolatopsis sp. lyj-346 TaxID=2789289 RepID=UPI00397C66F6
MGLFGDMLDAAKHVGSEIARAVQSGGERLGNVLAGAGVGLLVGGLPGAIAGAYVGSQTGTGAANPQAAGLSPGQLVRAVLSGPGTESLQKVHQAGVDQSAYQRRLEQGTRELTSALESAWTGGASDAARERLKPLTASATSASTTLDRNSTLAQAQIDQFHRMKNSLHPDVKDQPPTRSAWDVATPWDTDTEAKINQYNRKAQENVERYNAYSRQSSSNTAARTIDYGQLREYTGGDFTVKGFAMSSSEMRAMLKNATELRISIQQQRDAAQVLSQATPPRSGAGQHRGRHRSERCERGRALLPRPSRSPVQVPVRVDQTAAEGTRDRRGGRPAGGRRHEQDRRSPRMTKRSTTTTAAIMAGGLLISACNGTPKAPANTTAPSSTASANSDVPAVPNPLPAQALEGSPCESALTTSQVSHFLGQPTPAKPSDTELGPMCQWSSASGSGAGITVAYQTKSERGIGLAYENVKPKAARWQPLEPVQGFPAVAYTNTDDNRACVIVVGVTDQLAFSTALTLGDKSAAEGKDCFDAAPDVADAVLTNLKARA